VFRTVHEARQELEDIFDPKTAEIIAGALVPAIVFKRLAEGETAAPGATRIGGIPDLPKAASWPVRPVPANAEEIIARGGRNHAPHIRKHLERELPFEFVAQVDLAEAARLGPAAACLPQEGRLLFFYDGAVAPWHNGPEACRVIWDRTPIAELVPKPRPEALAALGEEYAKEWNETAAKKGWALASPDDVPYWGPAQPARLEIRQRLPHTHSVEMQENAELSAALKHEDAADAYYELFSVYWDKKGDEPTRQQLLGPPLPEQDDPRYDAVTVTEFRAQHLSREERQKNWPAIAKAAADWRLLLQLDLNAYLRQEFVEGTVYFLIHRADLAARAFDKAVAVYQQT
jgi:uncharacterized protein YwqG